MPQSSQNLSVPHQTWPAKFGQNLIRTTTRLMFCNRKLMRTDIFSLGSPNSYATSWTLRWWNLWIGCLKISTKNDFPQMKIKLYYLSDTEKNKFMFLTLNNLLNSETVTRNPNLFIDCDQIVFRFIYSGVKPLIH